jgi:hypothetical protein
MSLIALARTVYFLPEWRCDIPSLVRAYRNVVPSPFSCESEGRLLWGAQAIRLERVCVIP